MRATKSKMTAKMAAIVRNIGLRYLVCNNFLKNELTTSKTPRLCLNIIKVIKIKFIWLFDRKVKDIFKVKCQNDIKNISREQLYLLSFFI